MQIKARYLAGPVIKGKQLGKKIGFPTANIQLAGGFSVEEGVYAVRIYHNYKKLTGIMNIGMRPTFQDGQHQTVEVHILDFNENLYGETLTIEKIAFLRSEQSFNGVEELIKQLHLDVQAAKRIFQSTKPYPAVV